MSKSIKLHKGIDFEKIEITVHQKIFLCSPDNRSVELVLIFPPHGHSGVSDNCYLDLLVLSCYHLCIQINLQC